MKISILASDLSHNCLGRAYLLAKILQRRYEVEIVGPLFGERIWRPVIGDKTIKYKSIKIQGKFKPYLQMIELLGKIEGDVIYASKPLLTSFGLGLMAKFFQKTPLVLDIDDWEMGFAKENFKIFSLIQRFKFLASSAFYPLGIGSYWNRLIAEKMIKFADEITVSNNFLRNKFGGTIIWHARDKTVFNPRKFNKNDMKKKYKINLINKNVMFLGSIGPYRGLEDLIMAVRLIKEANLIIVGLDKSSYSLKILEMGKKLLKKRFFSFGVQPFNKVPEFLIMADLIVIPQRKNLATIGQMPAKVFDAMAMQKTIVATAVSDLPLVLNKCGTAVEPGNYQELSRTINDLLKHPQRAGEIAKKAREKFVNKYSFGAMEKVLANIFKKYEA